MLKRGMSRLATLGVVMLLVAVGIAFAACGGSDEASTAADAVRDEAAHVEGDVDEAAHDEGDDGSTDMGDMDMGDDEAAHDEGDAAHVEGDEHEADPEAHAYLEAAPKDALYLVQMTNFAYTPSVLEVNSGEVLEIAVQNGEPLLHDFTIEQIDADVHISYLEGSGQHAHAAGEAETADVHFPLSEPGVGVVHLKIHEPGEYVFYCTVPGHREAGMEGTLIVR